MPGVMTCPHGHQWEPPADGSSDTLPVQIPCPVCGAPVPTDGGPPAAANADTVAYAAPPPAAPAAPPSAALQRTAIDSQLIAGSRPPADSGPPDVTVISQEQLAPEAEQEWPKVPGFDILRELGRGGMGVVYLAHEEGLDRFVALKMILAGSHAGSEERIRFKTEAVAVSRLQHVNLVQIYHHGEHEGRPYFALEFVDGGSLDDKLRGKPMPPAPAARLVETLARAIHFAHERGVIHRDLKPANVLMTIDGVPKITDFGLAKRMDSGHDQTRTGAIMGTPSYMAPEQAAGQGKSIGPHTDVYALGAILYELLTGRPPFVAETGWDTIVQVVNQEPLPPVRLQPKLPRDLNTICLKCLEKEPRKRYASAAALADDLACFLKGEPIEARPVGPVERTLKWVRRRPAAATLLAVTVVGAIAALVGGWSYNQRLQGLAEQNRRGLVRLNVASGNRYLEDGDWFGALVWFVEALNRDHADPERERLHRTRYAAVLRQCPRLVQLWFHNGAVRHASFSPDGRRVVTASDDGTARVWDVATGEPVGKPLGGAEGGMVPAAMVEAWFSPDGERVLTASSVGTAEIWDVATGKRIVQVSHGRALYGVAFSPDGRRFVTAAAGDGTSVAGTQARVWDAANGRQLGALPHDAEVYHAAFSRDGRRLVTASADRTARVWDAGTYQPVGTPFRHGSPVLHAALSPDDQTLATSGRDGTVLLWKVATGAPLAPPLRHTEAVRWSAFSPDGRQLVTASEDDTAKLWDAATGALQAPPLRHGSDVRRYACFSPDGCWVATSSNDNTARVWDARTGEPAASKLTHNGTVHCVAFSPDGHHLITASDDNTARLWDLAAGSLQVPAETDDPFRGEGLVADDTASAHRAAPTTTLNGHRLELVLLENTATVRDAATGETVTPTLLHRGKILDAAFSPDGRYLVTASADQTAQVWETIGGAQVCPPLRHASTVSHAEFSPDGRQVVTGSDENSARIWDVATGKLLTPPLKHHGTVDWATFSPNGLRVATASLDQTARVWDAASGEPITPPLRHYREVREIRFSTDGSRVLTRTADGVVREWELPRDDRPIRDLALLADVLAGSRLGSLAGYWPLESDELRDAWRKLKGQYPESFAATADDVLAWDRRMADACATGRHWSGATWHLDRLIAEQPQHWQDRVRRGNAYAEQGRWNLALTDFAAAAERRPAGAEAEIRYRVALLHRAAGDSAAYRRACEQLLAGGRDDPALLRAVTACNVTPEPGLDRAKVLRAAEAAAAKHAGDGPWLLAVGGALVRAGRYQAAVSRLDEALRHLEGGLAGEAGLYLALAHQGLGHGGEARKCLDRVAQRVQLATPEHGDAEHGSAPLPWPRRLEIQFLLKEAGSKIDGKKS